jgi:hypothetical protein
MDLISARSTSVVKPLPAVPARPVTAHLHQPRPHRRGRGASIVTAIVPPRLPLAIGARERRAKLFITGSPATKTPLDETARPPDSSPMATSVSRAFRVAFARSKRAGGLLCHDSPLRRPNVKYDSGPRKLIKQIIRQRLFGPRMRAAGRR